MCNVISCKLWNDSLHQTHVNTSRVCSLLRLIHCVCHGFCRPWLLTLRDAMGPGNVFFLSDPLTREVREKGEVADGGEQEDDRLRDSMHRLENLAAEFRDCC